VNSNCHLGKTFAELASYRLFLKIVVFVQNKAVTQQIHHRLEGFVLHMISN